MGTLHKNVPTFHSVTDVLSRSGVTDASENQRRLVYKWQSRLFHRRTDRSNGPKITTVIHQSVIEKRNTRSPE